VHGGADLNELKTGGPSTNYEQFYDNLELWNLLTFKVETTISQQRLIDILYRTLEFIDEKIQEKLNNKD
jgi:hypothetical protein